MQTIINELYKTNLKFRTNDSGIIEILNQSFIPIAAIFPVVTEDTPIINPNLTDYLTSKADID